MPHHLRPLSCLLGALLLSALPAAAQPARPTFDVVSVKESPPPVIGSDGSVSISMGIGSRPGGRWIAQNSTFLRLIQQAFDGFSLPGQIADAPEWASRTRFDVNAVAAGDRAPAEMNEMVKAMLADRFGLKVRIEPREIDVYYLVLARADGRLGPSLKPSTVDCAALAEARKKGELPPAPRPRPGERIECGMMQTVVPGGQKTIVGGQRLSGIIGSLQTAAERPVIDRTGLTGNYDIELEFASNRRPLPAGADTTTAPSVFTAVQEQLGLKLESGKERMDVLVIEAAHLPTPD